MVVSTSYQIHNTQCFSIYRETMCVSTLVIFVDFERHSVILLSLKSPKMSQMRYLCDSVTLCFTQCLTQILLQMYRNSSHRLQSWLNSLLYKTKSLHSRCTLSNIFWFQSWFSALWMARKVSRSITYQATNEKILWLGQTKNISISNISTKQSHRLLSFILLIDDAI